MPARLVGSEDNCLERSLVAYRYLAPIGAYPQLTLGLQREEGCVVGHAWVRLAGEPQGESPASLSKFSELVSFTSAARSGRPH